jgi:hypothetical protein
LGEVDEADELVLVFVVSLRAGLRTLEGWDLPLIPVVVIWTAKSPSFEDI